MISRTGDIELGIGNPGACPECGSAMDHQEGCTLCRSCGHSPC